MKRAIIEKLKDMARRMKMDFAPAHAHIGNPPIEPSDTTANRFGLELEAVIEEIEAESPPTKP